MSGIAGVIALLLVAILCVLPAAIACNRRHKNMTPILILNMFLGWVVIFSTALTVIGWVLLLAWSFSSNVRPAKMKDLQLEPMEQPYEYS